MVAGEQAHSRAARCMQLGAGRAASTVMSCTRGLLLVLLFACCREFGAVGADVGDMCTESARSTDCLWPETHGKQILNFSCMAGPEACGATCCSKCFATPNCVAYTWWGNGAKKQSANRCFLLSHSYGGPTNVSSTCRSGVRPPSPTVAPPAGSKNVLMIVVDDMRAQLNVSFGQDFMITPNLDRLAASGVVFERAYVQMAWCSPSRNSFMTGRYPDTLQIWDFGKSFRDTPENPPTGAKSIPDLTVVALPQYFKNHGYLTLGGGKVYHPNTPINNDVPYSWSPDIPYFPLVRQDCPGPNGNITKVGCGGCPSRLPDEVFYDWQLANHTVHLLRFAKQQQRPFFIAAGFRRPHTPWFINQRFVDLYENGTAPPVLPPKYPGWAQDQPPCAFICGGDGVGCDFNISSPRPVVESTLCRRTYYAAVTATDDYIGMILNELDALQLTKDTVVVVFGDHGWHLGEGDQFAKYTVLEYATRTPLILRAPWAASAGSRVKSFAELADIYPTLAELAGLPAPAGVEGSSLVPALKSPNAVLPSHASAHHQFAHCCPKGTVINASVLCGMCGSQPSSEISYMGYGVRNEQWRWVQWHQWDNTTLRPQCTEMAVELYPHANDAGVSFDSAFETVNVAAQPSMHSAVLQMRKLLRRRFPKAFVDCP